MLDPANDTKYILQNKSASIEVDLFGGAIIDFHLQEHPVNPLTFHFTKKQMPANNKAGAPYQGHFACIGRWGEPTAGEIKAGLPNHGQPANMLWQIKRRPSKNKLQKEVTSPMEGLHIRRSITMDKQLPLYHVKETITNINTLGRWYHVVQHPTIAAPFLDNSTVINCNASKGFEYRNAGNYRNHLVTFPNVKDDQDNLFRLTNPKTTFNSVFSFIIKKDEPYGWITACSPSHALLFGYVWPREHYPWISLWQHFDNNIIKYRGLEFGTTGLHQPFKTIIEILELKLGYSTH